MTKLEALYDEAYQDNISVVDAHFSKTKKAACLHSVHYKAIVLDRRRIINSAEEGALLVEEVGHFKTGGLSLIEATYNMPHASSNRMKCEAKAKGWAYERYLPHADIQEAIDQGCHGDFEVAEYCGVTVEFLREAFRYYVVKGYGFAGACE